jgi:Resolvase, N terminal domain/Group II intron, maturase-specific domain
MISAAIYARVSSARQKKDQTIGSQTAALREHAQQLGLDVAEDWVFQDEGHSGATLVRPGLERLRDLAAQGCLDVILCYSPDRLARKFAYQALLIEEFTRCGVRVEFVKNGARGDTPEDQLLVQFQGMFAEYEKAQIMERRDVIADLNPVLRGWAGCFRTGSAAHKFRQVDWYVTSRLYRLMVKKRGRNLHAGQAQAWTEEWLNGHGLYRLRGTIRYPKAA